MPLKRAQGEAALRHVVRNVLNQPDDGSLERSLTRAELLHVGELGSLIETDIENLTYVAATEGEAPPQAPIPIGPGQRGILRAFIAYIRYRATQPSPIGVSPIGDAWNDITQEEFDTYRISPSYNGTIGTPSVPNLAKNVGHFMSSKILNDDAKKIIFRSNVNSALNSTAKTLRLDPISGETSIPVIIKSRHDSDSRENKEYQHTPMPVFHPSNLVDKTFLTDLQEDRQRLRACIVRAIEDHDGEIEDNPTRIKFLCSINDDDESEEIITYNEILNHIEVEENDTFFETIAVANEVASEMPKIDLIIDDCIMHRNMGLYEAHAREVKTKETDYEILTRSKYRIKFNCSINDDESEETITYNEILNHIEVEENDTFFETIAVASEVASEMPNIDLIIDDCIMHRNIGLYEAQAREVKTKEPDCDPTRPHGRGPPRPPFRDANLHAISHVGLGNVKIMD
jgi:hypothetical protein